MSVNPVIVIDFKKNLNLVIRILHNEETKEVVIKGEVDKEDVNKASSVRSRAQSSDKSSVQ